MVAGSTSFGVGVPLSLLYASLREILPWAEARFNSSAIIGETPTDTLSGAPSLDRTLEVVSKVLGH